MSTRHTFKDAEAQFRNLFDSNLIGICFVGSAGRVTTANEAFLNITGYTKEDILSGKLALDRITPEEYRHLDGWAHEQMKTTGSCAPCEKEFLRKDGTRVPVLVGGALADGIGGELLYFVLDITTRRSVEHRLLVQHSVTLALAESSSLNDASPRILRAICSNLDWELGLGWKVDGDSNVLRCIGLWRNPSASFPEFETAARRSAFPLGIGFPGEVWSRGEPLSIPDILKGGSFPGGRIAAKEGLRSAFGFPIMLGNKVLGVMEFFSRQLKQLDPDLLRTMTTIGSQIGQFIERHSAMDALRESQSELADFVENVDLGMQWLAPNGVIQWANEAELGLVGYTRTEYVGRHITEFHVDPTEVEQALVRLAGGEALRNFEAQLRCKDGSIKDVLMNANMLWRNRRAVRVRCYTRDITERKRTHERLREQAALLDHARDAIILTDLQGHTVFWNKSAERLYGWSAAEVTAKNVRRLKYRRKDRAQFDLARASVLRDGEWTGELREFTKQGKEIIVESRWALVTDDDGTPRSILVINTDITEKKELEAKYLRAQRLESIGTLTAGFAHDMSNVLSPILMGIEALRQKLSDDEDAQSFLALLKINTDLGVGLLNQMLSFARGAQGELGPINPARLIRETAKNLSGRLPRSVKVNLVLGSDLWDIQGDWTQLSQVLLNLCLNSRAAMPDGGTLTISAENRIVEDKSREKPARFVVIAVGDTGLGMSPDVAPKVFEPFFTTKDTGEGTGLGLAMVLGIVQAHAGFVDVVSKLGEGTEVKVFIPASETKAHDEVKVKARELPSGFGETILVVDREVAILEAHKRTLEAFGYNVLTALDSREAVRLCRENNRRIKAILTDLSMSDPSGTSTVRLLRELDPDVRIIATASLNATRSAATDAKECGVSGLLVRPYTPETLLKQLSNTLRGST